VTLKQATADKRGDWEVTFPPQQVQWGVQLTAKASSRSLTQPPTASASTTTVSTAHTTVNVGEVVMCAGQSNMDMPVACSFENKTACYHPKLVSIVCVGGEPHTSLGCKSVVCCKPVPINLTTRLDVCADNPTNVALHTPSHVCCRRRFMLTMARPRWQHQGGTLIKCG
jgi:hypothetical protein